MTITIKYSDILEGIYASSSLATLSRDCSTALLHPDHADALRRTSRDALAAIIAAAPAGCIRLEAVTDTGFDIAVSDDADSVTASALLLHAITTTTTGIIAAAAGLAPLPDIPTSWFDALAPSWHTTTRIPAA